MSKYQIIKSYDKFTIAKCNFPSSSQKGYTEYAVLKFGTSVFSEAETFLAISDEQAEKIGLEIAKNQDLL